MSASVNVIAAGVEIAVRSGLALVMNGAMAVTDQLTLIVTPVFLIPVGIQTENVYVIQDSSENIVTLTKVSVMEPVLNVQAQQQLTAFLA